MKEEKENYDFESEMGRQLRQRRMSPSDNAWERVSLLREKKSHGGKKFRFWWIAAAAVVVFGGLQIADRPISADKVTEPIVVADPPVTVQNSSRLHSADVPGPDNVTDTTAAVKHTAHRDLVPVLPMQPVPPRPERPAQQILATTAGAEARKILEITAAVDRIAASGQDVGEDDIDELIEKARQDMASGNGPARQTDASALLRDSENELSQEFRSNVFKELIKHKRIRIAFGDR